jgi:hypothetical protein
MVGDQSEAAQRLSIDHHQDALAVVVELVAPPIAHQGGKPCFERTVVRGPVCEGAVTGGARRDATLGAPDDAAGNGGGPLWNVRHRPAPSAQSGAATTKPPSRTTCAAPYPADP